MTYEELVNLTKNLSVKELAQKEKTLAAIYRRALKEIQAEVAAVYAKFLVGVKPEDYYNEMIKFDRLLKLQMSIAEAYKPFGKEINLTITASAKQAISNSFYYKQYALDWIAPTTFGAIPNAAIQISVFKNADFIKKIVSDDAKTLIPRYGGTLKTILRDNNLTAFNRIISDVENSLLTGSSFRDTAKGLTSVFDGNFSNSLRTVRTESHRNLESGSFTQWTEAEKKGVEGFRQIISVLDSRTRAQSARVDGRKDHGKGFLYPNGQRYFIPGNTGVSRFDINDRETTIEIVDGVEPTVRRGRNPATGENEVIDFKSFDAWAKDNKLKRNVFGELVA